jgi:hypothetical protein
VVTADAPTAEAAALTAAEAANNESAAAEAANEEAAAAAAANVEAAVAEALRLEAALGEFTKLAGAADCARLRAFLALPGAITPAPRGTKPPPPLVLGRGGIDNKLEPTLLRRTEFARNPRCFDDPSPRVYVSMNPESKSCPEVGRVHVLNDPSDGLEQ